jgi:hypothetical protein
MSSLKVRNAHPLTEALRLEAPVEVGRIMTMARRHNGENRCSQAKILVTRSPTHLTNFACVRGHSTMRNLPMLAHGALRRESESMMRAVAPQKRVARLVEPLSARTMVDKHIRCERAPVQCTYQPPPQHQQLSRPAATCARAWQHREAAADRSSTVWECPIRAALRRSTSTLPSQAEERRHEQSGGAGADAWALAAAHAADDA